MTSGNSEKPLIVQGDYSLLLETFNKGFPFARDDISPFSELEKSPEHIHTYRLTNMSLWNAASSGLGASEIMSRLKKWARFPVPKNVEASIVDIVGRYGKLELMDTEDPLYLRLAITDPMIFAEISSRKALSRYLVTDSESFLVRLYDRGTVKVELIKLGYPVKDTGTLSSGDPLDVSLKTESSSGAPFSVRGYQEDAVQAFYGSGAKGNGFGVIVLPCGSGKTVVGMRIMEMLKTKTLILTTNIAAVHQWMDELKDKTSLDENDICEYSGERKNIGSVTIATYQIITYRPRKDGDFPHFSIFRSSNWGLIIYDEVHLLPAPVFRVTAEIQSVRRLGLTATLVREDGKENEVFSLVGPKRFDIPWKELEQKGWIAEAYCHEIRIDLPDSLRLEYACADNRKKYRVASENPLKEKVVLQLVENHINDSVLVIGQYIQQLTGLAKTLDAPLITGSTPNNERESIYASFREGKERVIVVSKVANFAIDLPDASVAIQVSGSFGSRQEEAQRLGRILRPKQRNSFFYSIVSHYTVEEDFALNRQKFLTEQGYSYQIAMWNKEELSL